MGQPLTTADLQPYRQAGIAAAARALRRHNTTVASAARRLGFEFDTITETERRRRQRHRQQLAGQVRRLARQRLSQAAICTQLGITRAVLRHIAAENSIDINSRA